MDTGSFPLLLAGGRAHIVGALHADQQFLPLPVAETSQSPLLSRSSHLKSSVLGKQSHLIPQGLWGGKQRWCENNAASRAELGPCSFPFLQLSSLHFKNDLQADAGSP